MTGLIGDSWQRREAPSLLPADQMKADRMKSKLTIVLMLLSMLMNNIMLATAPAVDRHMPANMSNIDSGADPGDHKDHATHCCHLQAHFQSVLVENDILTAVRSSDNWVIPVADTQTSHIFSPPTPPPRV